jgi:hypothetical protein
MTTQFCIAPIRQGQKRAKPFLIDHTADPLERISATGGEIGIFLVENEVSERAHIKRSIDKWIKVS